MLDTRGFVAETNATHVFIACGGEIRTPRTVACPEGITRATVLDLCREATIPFKEMDLSLTDVYAADEMFCTGTMGELALISRIDGRTIGTGTAGPLITRLTKLFSALTRREGEQVIDQA